MIFDYFVQKVFTQSIDIEDIGNMALCCTNKENASWYLITKTIMGKTSILTFGPVIIDLPILISGFKFEYEKIDYKEPKIHTFVSKYINDQKKEIEKVEEISDFEALEVFPNILELYNDL